ncbi:Stp1/IreP family PP2C-type Ser/Thr phosphatase [Streptococcaceae bacterium ESL0729]|nr:Stp1/IreP family PP2C-type Ser/Thr phosphatase [Streptococcaceae bacterium ESL0729]
MKFTVLTDVGIKRVTNQDFADVYTNKQGQKIFILADGMGGHAAGNVASRLAVEDLGKLWQDTNFSSSHARDEISDWLVEKISVENQNIADLGRLDDFRGMGTTLEIVIVLGSDLISAHVGDSRTQIIRDNHLIKVTRDHSLVQELLDAGELTEEEAENHPNKNIVTKSIGQQTFLEPDINIVAIEAGDYILLSSDGLTNMVAKDEIVQVVEGPRTIEDKAEHLIELANNYGGHDNVTVILLEIDKEAC